MNQFDFLVTLASVVDLIIALAPGTNSGFNGILTALRLLRLLRLARFWKSLYLVIHTVLTSFASVIYLSLLLMLLMFIAGLLGMSLFGYRLDFCILVTGSKQLCPPGLSIDECPRHFNCYVGCDPALAGIWYQVPNSPYGGQGYCEEFPAQPADGGQLPSDTVYQYWAQVGKPLRPDSNFDDIFQAMVTVFQLLTLDNWTTVLHLTMSGPGAWSAVYFLTVMVISYYVLLALFLAILLENLDSLSKNEDDHLEEGSDAGAPPQTENLDSLSKNEEDSVEEGSDAGAPPKTDAISLRYNNMDALVSQRLHASAQGKSFTAAKSLTGGKGYNAPSGKSFIGAPRRSGSGARDSKGSNPPGSRGSAGGGLGGEGHSSYSSSRVSRLGSDSGRARGMGSNGIYSASETLKTSTPTSPLMSERGRGNALARGGTQCRLGSGSGEEELTAAILWADDSVALVGLGERKPTSGMQWVDDSVTLVPTRKWSHGGSALPPRAPVGNAMAQGKPAPGPRVPPDRVDEEVQWGRDAVTRFGSTSPSTASPDVSQRQSRGMSSSTASPVVTQRKSRDSYAESSSPQASGRPVAEGRESSFGGIDTSVKGADTSVRGADSSRGGVEAPVRGADTSARGVYASVGGADASVGEGYRKGNAEVSVQLVSRSSPHNADVSIRRGSRSSPQIADVSVWRGSRTSLHSTDVSVRTGSQSSELKSKAATLSFNLLASEAKDASIPGGSRRGSVSISGALPSGRSVLRFNVPPPEPKPERKSKAKTKSTQPFLVCGVGQNSNQVVPLDTVGAEELGYAGVAATRLGSATGTRHWTQRQGEMKTFGDNKLHGNALFLFGPHNKARVALDLVVNSTAFQGVMIALILASSACLTLDTVDTERDSKLGQALYILDIIFTTSFCIEVILNTIVYGFAFNGTKSYIRNAWNMLDLFIAVLGVVVIVLEAVMSDRLHGLTGLNVAFSVGLRLLRAANKVRGIHVVVKASIAMLPAISHVILVGALFYYMFSPLFAGKLYYCTDEQSDGQLTGDFMDAAYYLPFEEKINASYCRQNSGQQVITSSYYHSKLGVDVPAWDDETSWTTTLKRFDNVFQALWTLFSAWSEVMHQTAATVGIDKNQIQFNNRWVQLYSISFILVGSFVMLNLLAGVAIQTFKKAQNAGDSALLTVEQQEWLAIQKIVVACKLKTPYKPPTHRLRRMVFTFIYSSCAETAIFTIILLNVFTMFLYHYDQGPVWDTVLLSANIVFTSVFTAEMLLKWIAIGLPQYFKEGWNIFDFIVVIIAIAGILLDLLTTVQFSALSLLRIFRVVRIFKLVPRLKQLQIMLQALIWSLPAVGNLSVVLLVYMYLYAILGMNLFGNIRPSPHVDGISRNCNFQTFSSTMLLLFRDNAFAIDQLPDDAYEDQCSIAPGISIAYFCSYQLVVSFLVLQLVIGLFLESINLISFLEEVSIGQTHVQNFISIWESLDPFATGFIPTLCLATLLKRLEAPLGVKDVEHQGIAIQDILNSVDIPNRPGNVVHFLEVLHALAGRLAGTHLPHAEDIQIHHKVVQRLPDDELPKSQELSEAS
eukprot:gene1589-32977_t